MYIILLGAPGAGKGTQARLLAEKLSIPQVASGDLFRENLGNNTPLGLLAKGYIDRGELVPDDVTIRMVQERLHRSDAVRGAILDGFPRTIAQAEALARVLAQADRRIACVPYIRVSEKSLLARLSGRWICPICQTTYHVLYSPPKVSGICDKDGSILYQRPDDTEETARNRLQVYFQQTAPLIEYYRGKGLLVEVDGEQSIEAVQGALDDVVAQHVARLAL
ncbi:MAG: adenylate kinase [Anaerolineae bacterium]|nr:adenylate kinase [Anaerolineae bacterium]